MRGIEEFQAAELHERNVAARQLDLQRPAVMRGAEQHRLRLQRRAGLALLQHLLADVAGLPGFVAHGDQPRPFGRSALGPEILGEALAGLADHRIGGGEDRLGRAVVAVERDDLGRRRELRGEIEDVAHFGGAKGIDRLRVVADHGQTLARPASAPSRIDACRRLVSWYSSTRIWSKRSPSRSASAGSLAICAQ